jgi:hypothetical protein
LQKEILTNKTDKVSEFDNKHGDFYFSNYRPITVGAIELKLQRTFLNDKNFDFLNGDIFEW